MEHVKISPSKRVDFERGKRQTEIMAGSLCLLLQLLTIPLDVPVTRFIATFFFVGLLRPAPGTWGSLAAIPLAWGIHWLSGPIGLAMATIGVFAAGLWATEQELLDSEEDDPGEIVVDEVIGQWIALLPVSLGASLAGVPFAALWPGIVVAFLAFRLFDIWKPSLIGRVDRRGDGLGVMLDDAVAGVAAAFVVVLLALLAHSPLIAQ